ncbi:MAG: DUF6886 family protein [Candidatus Izemoplasmataceae bacterium]
MRLFHISEDPNIEVFKPIVPKRDDINQSHGVVWALCERTLPNFLTPRDCPRVTYHVGPHTTEEDKKRYFSSSNVSHCVVIEHRWLSKLLNTELTIYEFDPKHFELQDEVAGYYISKEIETPIRKYKIKSISDALIERNIVLRILPELFTLRDQIIHTSFNWSMCRMKNAK